MSTFISQINSVLNTDTQNRRKSHFLFLHQPPCAPAPFNSLPTSYFPHSYLQKYDHYWYRPSGKSWLLVYKCWMTGCPHQGNILSFHHYVSLFVLFSSPFWNVEPKQSGTIWSGRLIKMRDAFIQNRSPQKLIWFRYTRISFSIKNGYGVKFRTWWWEKKAVWYTCKVLHIYLLHIYLHIFDKAQEFIDFFFICTFSLCSLFAWATA